MIQEDLLEQMTSGTYVGSSRYRRSLEKKIRQRVGADRQYVHIKPNVEPLPSNADRDYKSNHLILEGVQGRKSYLGYKRAETHYPHLN